MKSQKPEEYAYVNHEGDTVYVALTNTGRSALLKEPLVLTFKEPVQVKTIILKHMPRRWSRQVEKGRPLTKGGEHGDASATSK